MDVSIIIVNYHTESLIKEAVKSLVEKTSGLSYEVIIVDSAPKGGFGKEISSWGLAVGIKYVAMAENQGFGAANNEGFKYSTGKYLFCLNPDTLLVNNAVKILFDYMESHPDCGAAGGNLYHENMRGALSFRRILPGSLLEFSERHHLHPERLLFGRNTRFNHTNHPIKVGYITGADLMLRADLIGEIGGFAPEFFMYFEETDLCCRIHRAGYRVISVPQAKIIHLEGKSMSEDGINPRKYKYYADSRVEYYKRNVKLSEAVKAYKLHLKSICKDLNKEGQRGEIAKVHYQYTLEALKRYPELKEALRHFLERNRDRR